MSGLNINATVDELRAWLDREDNPFKHAAMGHPDTVDYQVFLAIRGNFFPFAVFFITPHPPHGKQHIEEIPFHIDWRCYDADLKPFDKKTFDALHFHKK